MNRSPQLLLLYGIIGFSLVSPIFNFGFGLNQVPFATISKGYYGGHYERADYVINSEYEWEKIWEETFSNVFPRPELPSVDFTKTTIIAVYMGGRPTGGYDIEIFRMRAEILGITVFIRERDPKPGGVTMAITHPYHIIVTRKVLGVVTFIHV